MREKEFLPRLASLGIESLNAMQRRMLDECTASRNVVLLSPTGSGKTLAFVLPVVKLLKPPANRVQALVIAPGRELVLQISDVIRKIAVGYKITALYGGHNSQDEANSLAATPDIVVATPGRLLDHAGRRNIDLRDVRMLVLDEFDKSLELGFEREMKKLMAMLKNVARVILTSATDMVELPEYLRLESPAKLSFLEGPKRRQPVIRVHRADSDKADKLESLHALLSDLARLGDTSRIIVFANYRESAERIHTWLRKNGVVAGLYHGALDQQDREKAVALFNNGSTPVLVATDLASRGLDIENVEHVVHYHQPVTPEAYTHRNGRTARAGATGDVYVLVGPDEDVKEFIDFADTHHFDPEARAPISSPTASLYFQAGKKDKLSRGDIVGFLAKEGGLDASDIGKITLADRYAIAAVPAAKARKLLDDIADKKIKGKKVRITLIK